LSFRNNYALEPVGGGPSYFDGAVLEISSPNIAGGMFTDITDAAVGGSFVTGGYNGLISTSFQNPIGGRMAWSQSSGGFINTIADLGPNLAGQTVKLRFRMGSDSSASGTGWDVDTVQLSVITYTCCNPATPTPPPTPSPTLTPTPTQTPPATPSPTPTATISISGNIDYCTNPNLNPVPGVTLNLTGTGSGTTLSNASGNYIFGSVGAGGSYTITPIKSPLPPGSAGISTVDVLAVQRHFLGLTLIPPGCRLTAADINGDSAITTVDVIAIQRFFLGFTSGTANAGRYKFTPANRSYSAISANQTGQNYDAIVFGDVSSSFVH
jgi:hypothetical protein